MSFAIRRDLNGMPVFFSPSAGKELGQPQGGWINDPFQALQFARLEDGEEFVGCYLENQQQAVRVVPV